MDMDELLDQRRVSKILGTSVKFLEHQRHRGGGPVYTKIGKLVRYKRADVMSWVESRRMHSTSQPAA